MDVKSAPVYFYAYKIYRFNTTGRPIEFENTQLNIGNAMDVESGIFTAPRSGIYFFAFTGQVGASDRVDIAIIILKNGVEVGRTSITETNTITFDEWRLVTLQTTQNLKLGDEVYLMIVYISPGTYLNSQGSVLTFFTGFLLEEEIVASL